MDIYAVIQQMRLERKRLEDIPLRVTYYARVSTLKEEQDTSIEAQISHFTQMIQNNPNWTFVQGYVDRVRGESADNRTQFKQMIQDGYDGKFDLILTKEVSRFARNTIDSLTYTRELLKKGVGVFFLTDNICTVEQDSELRLTIMSSIAQDEVRKLSERVKFGHQKAISQGHVLGNSRIFGYEKVNSKLVINEYEAEMVRLVFETYATGDYGLRYIENLLWNKGYRNRNGKQIHHNTLVGIISNPKYKGYFCGNKVKIIDYRTKEQKFLPQTEWVMFKDKTGQIVPAIVSEEVWERANQVLQERSEKVKATDRCAKKTSPLSGKIICGAHNEPFWRSSYSRSIHQYDSIYQWICRRKKRGKASDCATIAIYESELYKILGEIILNLTKEDIDTYINEFVALYQEINSSGKYTSDISNLEKKIDKLKNKQSKLLDLFTEDIISKTEFQSHNDNIKQELSRLTEELKNKQKQNQDDHQVAKNLLNIRNMLLSIIENNQTIETVTRDYINDICDLLLDSIVVYPIDKNHLKLEIHLVWGNTLSQNYERHIQRSGHIGKKMMPKLRKNNQYATVHTHQNQIEITSFNYTFCETRSGLKNHPDINITYFITLIL